jgi:predicted MFS family arabinose efflux permease
MQISNKLEKKLKKRVNFLRFIGFGFMALSLVAFLFSREEQHLPLTVFTTVLLILSAIGVAFSATAQMIVRNLKAHGETRRVPFEWGDPDEFA